MSGLGLLRRLPLVLLVYGFALQAVANGWSHALGSQAPICHAGPFDGAGGPERPAAPASHDCVANCVLSCGDLMPLLPQAAAVPTATPGGSRLAVPAATGPAGQSKLAAFLARGPPIGG
jgi:hypothetical protein